jgi:uncharacterized protein
MIRQFNAIRTPWAPCLVAILLLLTGCGNSPTTAPAGPTIDVKIKDKHFALEVAATDKQREVGLMNRKSMPADHGMLFLFDKPRVRAFWMSHTTLPLDLIYLDEHGKVVDVLPLVPNDTTPIYSSSPILYAIELNRDAAGLADVHVGDHIELPKDLPVAEEDPR